MTKKKIFCILLCFILLSITGCSETATHLPIDDGSTVSSEQSAEKSSEPSSNESIKDSSTATHLPIDDGSTVSSEQSAGKSTEPSSNESIEDSSTATHLPIDDGSTVSSEQSAGKSSEPSSNESIEDSSTSTQSEKTTNPGDDNMQDTYKLIVNEKEIDVSNHIKLNFEYHYAELPLTAIVKELGAKVEWQSNTTAKITLGEKGYLLDTTKGSLIEIGNTFNVLVVAPGSKHGVFYRVVDNEFVIDSDSANLLLINIMGANISIDYEHRIVNINTIQ